MKVDHIHRYLEVDSITGRKEIDSTIICYKDDCYSTGGPSLDLSLFPPEKIGPKLYVTKN